MGKAILPLWSAAQPSILLHYLYGCKTLLPTFLDSIALPLRLQNPTTYLFQTVVSGTTTSTATLTLTYNTEETFVSKACGIKTTYNTLSATIQDANTSWLKGVTIKNNTIDNEKKAHIHLYH